ncbi:MAG: NAD(P)H-binding protein, partial [Magnetococcales bacterium]|nr:NAD(P)H-binding protein [Magnetococcales bacterium]
NTFTGVHAQGVRNLVTAAQKAGVQRFVHMSALGTRPHAKSQYHQSKWQGEEAVRQSGLSYTIFRPSVIFGPRDEFVNQLAKMIRYSPIAPILGDGKARMQPIWVEDVVRCFAESLKNPLTHGQLYELGGPHQLTFREVIAAIVNAMGRKRWMVSLPFPFLQLEAALLEKLPNPPLTRDQLIMAREDNICDNRLMRQTFGFEPRSFQDGLRDYYLDQ